CKSTALYKPAFRQISEQLHYSSKQNFDHSFASSSVAIRIRSGSPLNWSKQRDEYCAGAPSLWLFSLNPIENMMDLSRLAHSSYSLSLTGCKSWSVISVTSSSVPFFFSFAWTVL